MQDKHTSPLRYLDYTGRDDVLGGGVKMVPIETSKGTFRVWAKRIGSHMAMYDDQEHFFQGLIQFIRDVDASGR